MSGDWSLNETGQRVSVALGQNHIKVHQQHIKGSSASSCGEKKKKRIKQKKLARKLEVVFQSVARWRLDIGYQMNSGPVVGPDLWCPGFIRDILRGDECPLTEAIPGC